jgi:hypothetical protein
MTRDQSKWYFYWRGEVRRRHYPQTDLSYIFLYIYELINGIGWRDPLQGYEYMMDVWQSYRQPFPKLDNYLVDWAADFVSVHHLNISLEQILRYAPPRWSGEWLDVELFRRFREDPLDLPYHVVMNLSNYDETRSKFYTEGGKAAIETYVPKVVSLVDSFLKKRQGMRMIEIFNPGTPQQRQKTIFQSAVYDASRYGQTITVTVPNISSHEPLRDFITQVVRTTENKLRELMGFKNKLRGIAIEPEIGLLIDRYLEKEMGGQKVKEESAGTIVKIDSDKVAQLHKDSEAVRQMLTSEQSETTVNVSTVPLQELHTGSRSRLERPVDAADGSLTELEPVSELLAALSNEQRALLQTLAQHGWEMEEGTLTKVSSGMMVALAVDEINAIALEQLGSLLIVQEGSKSIVEDDYRDELEYLFAHQELIPKRVHEIVWEVAATAEDDVLRLAERLQPHHHEVLFALKQGQGISEIQRIAERVGTMPELLLDEINDAAMETIGDLLIDNNAIIEEYLPLFDQLRRGE